MDYVNGCRPVLNAGAQKTEELIPHPAKPAGIRDDRLG